MLKFGNSLVDYLSQHGMIEQYRPKPGAFFALTQDAIDRVEANSLPGGYMPTTKPRIYQREGIKLLYNSPYLALFDEMGLGKTLQLIYAAACLIRAKEVDCCVVFIKASHYSVWQEQLAAHEPRMRTYNVIGRPPTERKKPWPMNHTDIYFINYELLSRALTDPGKGIEIGKRCWVSGPDISNLLKLTQNRRCAAILDESQCIQSIKANVTKVLCNLKDRFTRRYIATGTPVTERPENLWSQLFFLDGGTLLGTNYYNFCNRHINYAEGSNGQRWPTGYKQLDDLRKKVRRISIRRTKDECLDLPPKIYLTPTLEPVGSQKKLLTKIRGELILELEKMSKDKNFSFTKNEGGSVSLLLQNMMKASAFPELVDPSASGSVKLDEFQDMLEQNPTEQFVVWCVHRNVAEIASVKITNALNTQSEFIHGGIERKDRNEKIANFKAGKFKVLTATMASLREAETLTNARLAYWMELGFERLNWVQSQDRHHRIGTTGSVILKTPICAGTLDRFIRFIVLEKKDATATISLDRSGGQIPAGKLLQALKEEK